MQPSKGCIERLTKEYKRLTKEPVPFCTAKPTPSNILEWHFVIEGAPSTVYEGGTYHGKIIFSPDYPFKPPGILFVTPSGRFTPNAKICFSFSDFHPEAWNPMWHVGTILNGVLSFMNEESTTTGSMSGSPTLRRELAKTSMMFNAKNAVFRAMFPEIVAKHKAKQQSSTQGCPDDGHWAGEDPSTQHNGNCESGRGAADATGQGREALPPWLNSTVNALPVIAIGMLAIGVMVFPMFSTRS